MKCAERRSSAGEAAKSTSIAGGLARAAFYAGGSISLADQPHVEAPADLTAQLVAELALAAATQFVRPEFKNACLRHYLLLAGEVSRGEAPWSKDDVPAEKSPAKSKELIHG